ncbi:peroxiredoxin [Achlya hypogyna]|uniref:Peroxiredoxin n=1 Tax=Achlya hypogyna TaxID=1202772 RepID=A0A1V9YX33_ACHHY|nr:peroxiredoxin [Achlya hypogyna]
MIAVGDSLPAVTLSEYNIVEGTCALGPNDITVAEEVANKTIVLFAVPGAFTPTCSSQHAPGFVQLTDEFKAAGVDEIWCLSVNDAYVMGAWGKELGAAGKIRMIADGDAVFTKATGLELDLFGKGLGLRSARYSMLVKNGVVKKLNLETSGGFKVSDAATILAQVRARVDA